MDKLAYMDYNATTPIVPAARHAIVAALDCVGNPSSVHGMGRKARALMEDARDHVARLLNVASDWVFFTSGGSEADALALLGTGCKRILVSGVEHPAILNACEHIEVLDVDENGLAVIHEPE